MWQRPFLADNEEERQRRLDAEDFGSTVKWRIVFAAGVLCLVAFAILAVLGLPGTGAILVPLGLGMVIFGGMEAFLFH